MEENEPKDLIKTVIKGRVETYYLVTDRDLEQIKSTSVIADSVFLIASVSFGAFVTIGNYLYLVIGLLMLFISLYFYYSKYSLIHKAKASGEIKNLHVPKEAKEEFKLVKATYGVPGKDVDVTSILKKFIKADRLILTATNALAGDPAPGIPKFLDIEYEHNGANLTKRYNERETINLP